MALLDGGDTAYRALSMLVKPHKNQVEHRDLRRFMKLCRTASARSFRINAVCPCSGPAGMQCRAECAQPAGTGFGHRSPMPAGRALSADAEI